MEEGWPTLYTIGHSNHDWGAFLALLRRHDIQTLVDVRSQPYSRRFPHFSRRELSQRLTDAGVDYEFYGAALGGRPPGVSAAWLAEEVRTRSYEALMERDEFGEGMARLLALLRSPHRAGALAVLCSEGDPLDCHRHHLIARYVLREGFAVAVRHIARDGALGRPLTREDFAIIEQKGLFG
ncbi:MAG: DUF488 domain-containing protein [Anaerolineaceae bacterium]|nr:DUF488 domain-containing protein [Anaerolineaceae bacterium]MCY3936576.1 DUF488 domain-containing protein [Chloroflexota bacterium]